jgi:hypothetical protein
MSENGLSSACSEIGSDVRVRASNLPLKRAVFAAYGLVSLMFIAVAHLHGADGPSPVGSYTLRGLREVGSELVIRADGHFEYMLAYGAYDEIAKGTWKLDGQRLLLNSEGEDKPAQFTLKRSDNRPEPGIFVGSTTRMAEASPESM